MFILKVFDAEGNALPFCEVREQFPLIKVEKNPTDQSSVLIEYDAKKLNRFVSTVTEAGFRCEISNCACKGLPKDYHPIV